MLRLDKKGGASDTDEAGEGEDADEDEDGDGEEGADEGQGRGRRARQDDGKDLVDTWVRLVHAATNESLGGDDADLTKTIIPIDQEFAIRLRAASDRFDLWSIVSDAAAQQRKGFVFKGEAGFCLVGGKFGQAPLAHPVFTSCSDTTIKSTSFERWVLRCAGDADESASASESDNGKHVEWLRSNVVVGVAASSESDGEVVLEEPVVSVVLVSSEGEQLFFFFHSCAHHLGRPSCDDVTTYLVATPQSTCFIRSSQPTTPAPFPSSTPAQPHPVGARAAVDRSKHAARCLFERSQGPVSVTVEVPAPRQAETRGHARPGPLRSRWWGQERPGSVVGPFFLLLVPKTHA